MKVQIFSQISFLLLSATLAFSGCQSTAPTVSQQVAPTSPSTSHKGAVIAGDHPDPSIIRVGNTYWAVATTSAWAPAFTILKSDDLVDWSIVGAAFETPPAWTQGNYWAPEIQELDGQFFIYYAAKDKKSGRMCVASATAAQPAGPYQDHGSLICEGPGSIDAMAVKDDSGEKYLFWKEDGNSQNKPTPIHFQKLNPAGTKLVGKKMTALLNNQPWEGNLIEGPYVLKHGEFWYLFYSGNGCCGVKCSYAMGVARASKLSGPWEKNPNNPILASNSEWKCPGHGSIVETPSGQSVILYHAYHNQDSIFVGRQALADTVEWNANGWPSINQGAGPSLHLQGFLGKSLTNKEHRFSENFQNKSLTPGWQWPHSLKPNFQLSQNEIVLRAPAKSEDFFGSILAKPTTVGNYQARTKIRIANPVSDDSFGLAAVGDSSNAIGISYRKGQIYVWDRTKNLEKVQAQAFVQDLMKTEGELQFQVTARDGHFFQFAYSFDGKTWANLGPPIDGSYLPPWDLGVRIALNSGRGEGHFKSFEMTPIL